MLLVQKFGGTSVGTIERITNVAKRVAEAKSKGNDVVVVVSAMAGETNRLLDLARSCVNEPDPRELDVLVSTGEQVSTALLAMSLISMGYKARSLQNHQVRLVTDSTFTKAHIIRIDAQKLRSVLKDGSIAIVAGFQGIDEQGDITTLGRGGSDTTAVAIAAALKPYVKTELVCEIYTDVDGVYTADPNIVPDAKKLKRISFEEMFELASSGAKVLQTRSVLFGMKFDIPIHVRSSFNDSEGTMVVNETNDMESVVVTGISQDKNEAKITVLHVSDKPGIAHSIFAPLAEAEIIVDMIIQSASSQGYTDMSFTVPRGDYKRALQILHELVRQKKATYVTGDEKIAKVSVVGVGMRTHSGVAAKMFKALAEAKVNIQMISTSEIKVSVVVNESDMKKAVEVLHKEFELGLER
ncbi:MAG: aspartate kinase [Bacteroidetes bacterium]|nr:aspartate kinase [Bacteroidota bacterium]MCL5267161.1 aspartate kinase [Bacteroidota bacterium]